MYSQGSYTIFGWAQISSNDSTKITLDDYRRNGLYCQSGLAYPANATTAKCSTLNYVQFKGQVLSDPYQCDPTAISQFCQIYYVFDPNSNDGQNSSYQLNGTRGFVQAPCKCSLGGSSDP